ncbi:MAG: NUDIX hydrolase [Deltaproteobacteria bacterium]|nr:NUDIX hydrolase [Deltaproteobacteria bacterium]
MKITGYKKITHKKWLNLFEVAYVDKNGQPKTWEVVSRKTTPKCITGDFIPPDAVVIVPFHRTEKKMVIIREYRVALAGFEYSLPAGLIDKEESIETASCRELKEETGLKTSAWCIANVRGAQPLTATKAPKPSRRSWFLRKMPLFCWPIQRSGSMSNCGWSYLGSPKGMVYQRRSSIKKIDAPGVCPGASIFRPGFISGT